MSFAAKLGLTHLGEAAVLHNGEAAVLYKHITPELQQRIEELLFSEGYQLILCGDFYRPSLGDERLNHVSGEWIAEPSDFRDYQLASGSSLVRRKRKLGSDSSST